MSLDSTRMSNELGTGNIGRDKNAMAVAIELSVILALIVVWAVAFGMTSGLASSVTDTKQ